MPELSDDEERALKVAQAAITTERAEQMLRVMHWRHGGCLTGLARPYPDVTEEERQVIQTMWDVIPDGSSCWMTALYRLVNSRRSVT